MNALPCWLRSSLERVYPGSEPEDDSSISLIGARNERLSFQVCVHNPTISACEADVSVSAQDGLDVLVRRVGYVPIPHHTTDVDLSEMEGAGRIPGLVPDPLFAGDRLTLGPVETQAFWVTVSIPADTAPGLKQVGVEVTKGGESQATLTAEITVVNLTVEPRKDFPVTHWFYADSLCDWYKCDPWDEKFWGVVEPYIADLVSHGNNCVYVPIFTPPTDGVKRPTQLLRVSMPSQGRYEFDFADVRRWTRLATRLGADGFEWTHLFTQWGVRHALRVYADNRDESSLFWPPETGATSEVYRNFLSQFLPKLHEFLTEENLLDKSVFHVSDEPHGDEHLANYRKARALLKELAPWMKVSDALSDIRYGQEGLTDNPIPSIAAAREYIDAGIPSWVYFCCGPRGNYLNRFVDTPLTKIRMSGWLFYKLGARGFLHWGYNYWYKMQTRQMIDPFTELSGMAWPGIAAGDTFLVYPGEAGPIDSIRWEVFAESLRDYALIQTLGVSPDDPLLAPIRGYDEFPKTAEWILATREQLLGRFVG